MVHNDTVVKEHEKKESSCFTQYSALKRICIDYAPLNRKTQEAMCVYNSYCLIPSVFSFMVRELRICKHECMTLMSYLNHPQ